MLLTTITILAGAVAATQAGSHFERSTSNSYAPQHVECPRDVEWIRPPLGLSRAEASWVHSRKRVVAKALGSYLQRLDMEDFDLSKYIEHLHKSNFSNVPTLGLAISGGGYASAFTGTGAMRALDSRLDSAKMQRTGGILQCLTYMSGLSGGSWPTVSFPVNNFPTVDEIVGLWRPEIDRLLFQGPSTGAAANSTTIFEDIAAKQRAGFKVGVPDYLAVAESYEFVGGTHGGLDVTFSSVVNQPKFRSHEMPFPIIQDTLITDDDREYFGLEIPYSNATIFEMTPFEFGAWNGAVSGFTPMEWTGTRLYSGVPVNSSSCVRGFDRAGFVMGTAGGAYNFWYIEDQSNGTLAPFSKRSDGELRYRHKPSLSKRYSFPTATLDSLEQAFQRYLHLNLSDISYASWPNPFAGLATSSSRTKSLSDLKVVDASEDGQTIPLWGQIQPDRALSFIIAWDDNSDAAPYNWNNGTNLRHTYLAAKAADLDFPIVPPAATFVNRNYTHRPVFFGCNAKLTTQQSERSPIVLYLANAPYSAYTNYSYAQSQTSREQISEIFTNSFNQVTQANGTLDSEWPVCLGCAVIDRSLAQMGTQRTKQCQNCFDRYCWDGTEDDGAAGVVDLSLALDPGYGFLEWNKTHPF